MATFTSPGTHPRPVTPSRWLTRSWDLLLALAIVIIALWVRLADQSLQYHLHADDAPHLRLGLAFAETGRFSWTVGRPGYALMLGAFIHVFGFHATSGMLLSTLFGTLTIIIVWIWARVTLGPTAAIVATVFAGFSAYPLFVSKITNPVGIGTAVQAAATMLLARACTGQDAPTWDVRRRSLVVGTAGLLSGFGAAIHPSFSSAPLVAFGFIAAAALATRRIRWGIGTAATFGIALGVTVLAWEAAFRLRPPEQGAHRYVDELLNVLQHQREWRAVSPPEPVWYYLHAFGFIEGPVWVGVVLAALLYGIVRAARGDLRYLAPAWFAAITVGIAVVNTGTGGVAIPRAMAMALPPLFVLVGGLIAAAGTWVIRVTGARREAWAPLAGLGLGCLALAPTLPNASAVIAARSGVLPAIERVQGESGWLAAQEIDPWVPALSSSDVALVGEKQSRQPAEARALLLNDPQRPCFAAMSGFVEVNGRTLILGNADPEPEPLPEPVATYRHDTHRLMPAVLDNFPGLGILTLTVQPTPELRLYREGYHCLALR